MVDVTKRELLTPLGLRSPASHHPDYKANYAGDLRVRDAAYHQGTVWGWVIGPYVDAYLKAYPDDLSAIKSVLSGFEQHLSGASVKFLMRRRLITARGGIAQAWSVAEVLRLSEAY